MMRRSLTGLFLLLALFMVGPIHAQDTIPDYVAPREPEKPKVPLRDRMYFGGNLGLSFGTVTNVSVEPFVGYKLTRNGKLSVGTGISYWYYNDTRYQPAYESSSYGYKFFTRYRILEPVFLHAEFNNMNFELFDYFTGESFRRWVPYLMVGGGYSQRLGGSSYFVIQALWDVLNDPYSPYESGTPWISAGVGVGF